MKLRRFSALRPEVFSQVRTTFPFHTHHTIRVCIYIYIYRCVQVLLCTCNAPAMDTHFLGIYSCELDFGVSYKFSRKTRPVCWQTVCWQFVPFDWNERDLHRSVTLYMPYVNCLIWLVIVATTYLHNQIVSVKLQRTYKNFSILKRKARIS
jgi:hypothetical protein